jgi:4Fe-4S ferredoxin
VKLLKNENDSELVIEMVLHTKHYALTLDKNKCVGCGICMQICPKEAIQATRTPKAEGENAKSPTVDINKEKCHYCGVCVALCPFGSLTLRVNGEDVIPVVGSKSFPQLIRDITVDEGKCDKKCLEVKEACPLDLIKVNLKKDGKVSIEIDKESCPGCRICETKFPDGAIRVKKVIEGSLRIDEKKCPEGCHDCVDVCPIPSVLVLSENGKVQVNEINCVYCGACKIACPEDEALELVRIRVRHTQVRSGAWNKALEKLASTKAVSKELQSKTGKKLQESVKHRFPEEVLDLEF